MAPSLAVQAAATHASGEWQAYTTHRSYETWPVHSSTDPWSNPWAFRSLETGGRSKRTLPLIYSAGPDGVPNDLSGDDVFPYTGFVLPKALVSSQPVFGVVALLIAWWLWTGRLRRSARGGRAWEGYVACALASAPALFTLGAIRWASLPTAGGAPSDLVGAMAPWERHLAIPPIVALMGSVVLLCLIVALGVRQRTLAKPRAPQRSRPSGRLCGPSSIGSWRRGCSCSWRSDLGSCRRPPIPCSRPCAA